jgi:hypothetical protein
VVRSMVKTSRAMDVRWRSAPQRLPIHKGTGDGGERRANGGLRAGDRPTLADGDQRFADILAEEHRHEARLRSKIEV